MPTPTPTPSTNKDFVTAYEPNFSLNEKIGANVDLAHIFTADRIAAGQKIIDKSKKSFFSDIEGEMIMLETKVNESLRMPEDSHENMESIAFHAHNIYGQAQLLGFTFIGTLCKHIVAYSENDDLLIHVRKNLITSLCQALRLSIKEQIVDEGGEIGREILLQLRKHHAIK
jgi:hypothetical protein